MPFSFAKKNPGDLIKHNEWNELMDQIEARVQKGEDTMTGPLSINMPANGQPQLRLSGGNWDVSNSQGDLRIGSTAHQLRIGVATGGGGAGDVRIRAVGGTNRLMLGGGSSDALIITGNNLFASGQLAFGVDTMHISRGPLSYGGLIIGGGPPSNNLRVCMAEINSGQAVPAYNFKVGHWVHTPSGGGGPIILIGSGSFESRFGVNQAGEVQCDGKFELGNSDLYFTRTNHIHTGAGNAAGHAAIENAQDYNELMILGRQVGNIRRIGLWDRVEVHGTFVNNSDERGKTDIELLKYGLHEIKQLQPVSFNWKRLPNPQKNIGLLAQAVKPVLQEIVFEDETNPDGNGWSISYISLIPVLINAVKELDEKLESAHLTIQQLRAVNQGAAKA